MRSALALVRAGWLTASSYRLNLVLSLLSQLISVVPVFFVARALQPVMAEAIKSEGQQFFGFLILGTIAVFFITTAVQALPDALSAGIANGTLEALLSTPTRLPVLLAGLTGYELSWTALRTTVLLVTAWMLGANVAWARAPESLLILALLVLAYVPVGIFTGALVLAFRTQGPFAYGVLLASGLLGGVYYPTHVIPSWFGHLSAALPLTYGLRALRRVLLDGAPLTAVAGDVGVLLAFVVVLLSLSGLVFARALRHAKRAGTLAQY